MRIWFDAQLECETCHKLVRASVAMLFNEPLPGALNLDWPVLEDDKAGDCIVVPQPPMWIAPGEEGRPTQTPKLSPGAHFFCADCTPDGDYDRGP